MSMLYFLSMNTDDVLLFSCDPIEPSLLELETFK